jgi:hypothetical protein
MIALFAFPASAQTNLQLNGGGGGSDYLGYYSDANDEFVSGFEPYFLFETQDSSISAGETINGAGISAGDQWAMEFADSTNLGPVTDTFNGLTPVSSTATVDFASIAFADYTTSTDYYTGAGTGTATINFLTNTFTFDSAEAFGLNGVDSSTDFSLTADISPGIGNGPGNGYYTFTIDSATLTSTPAPEATSIAGFAIMLLFGGLLISYKNRRLSLFQLTNGSSLQCEETVER